MKKLMIILTVFALILGAAGCGAAAPKETPAPQATAQAPADTATPTAGPTIEPTAEPQVQVSLYIPNANADGFDLLDTYIPELTEGELMTALISAGVFPADVAVNSCQLTQNAQGVPMLALDMNAAFAQVMNGTGTTGEYLYMGSLVNTFLNAFGATFAALTVDGAVLETGHSIYDFELTWYENY